MCTCTHEQTHWKVIAYEIMSNIFLINFFKLVLNRDLFFLNKYSYIPYPRRIVGRIHINVVVE